MSLVNSIMIGLLVCAASPVWAERALLAVATNFAETAQALGDVFEQGTDHEIQFAFGSTGKIYAQIQRGAPFDGFLAADQHRPALLYENGHGERPFTYAQGILVWWPDQTVPADTGKFAIANPRLAPYGAAAREVLMNTGAWDKLQGRLVMGENIGQTFAMVASGNATAGLVALSSVKSERNDKGWSWSLAQDHAPIFQDAILLERGRNNPAATAFMAFLKTREAQHLIAEFGYNVGPHD